MFSVSTVVKKHPQASWGGKGLLTYISMYSPSLRTMEAGTQAETEPGGRS